MIDQEIEEIIKNSIGLVFKGILFHKLHYPQKSTLWPDHLGVKKALLEFEEAIEKADEGDRLTSKYKYVREYK